MTEQTSAIVERVSDVVSPPQVYLKVEQLLTEPECDAGDVARVIETDPALTSRLLRLVNSPIYGLASKVEVVRSAVAVLGMAHVKELVLAGSVVNTFRSASRGIIDLESYWKHSVAVGVLARDFAVIGKEREPDPLFASGLLHDLGHLVLLMECPDRFALVLKRAQKEQRLLRECELDEFGFTHAELGAGLLRHWHLSERFCASIACHHDPRALERYVKHAAYLHLADFVVHALGCGVVSWSLVPPLDPQVWEMLGLPAEPVSGVLNSLAMKLNHALAFVLDQ